MCSSDLKIDLTKNEIETKKGTIIKIADMGTGQGQSAFLKEIGRASCRERV